MTAVARVKHETVPVVDGTCDPRFASIRTAFQHAFESGEELGAAVAVVVDGSLVVDLWGGYADQQMTAPWRPETLANIFSATKGALAIGAQILIDGGRLDPDAPVCRYWREFGAAGKSDITVRNVLNHTAGMAAFQRPMEIADVFQWTTCTGALADQEPLWTPGVEHGYHALTFGWLLGEIVRRVTGATVSSFLHRVVRSPGGASVRLGLGSREQRHVAEMGPYPRSKRAPVIDGRSNAISRLAFGNPPLFRRGLVNSAEWRGAEIPAANGHATARDLAGLYASLLNADGLLSPEAVRRCAEPEVDGFDLVLQSDTSFSQGFMLGLPRASASAFGHPGAGGSLGFCDPNAGIGFGYVMNRMEPTLFIGRRARRLIDALYDALGAPISDPSLV